MGRRRSKPLEGEHSDESFGGWDGGQEEPCPHEGGPLMPICPGGQCNGAACGSARRSRRPVQCRQDG
eukprot:9048319-Alexandrium_andersonii.AAC.2